MISFEDVWRHGPLYLMALMVPVSISMGGISVWLLYLVGAIVLVRDPKMAVWPEKRVLWALGALFGTYFLATVLSAPYDHHWHKYAEELWIKLLLIAVPLVAGRDSKNLLRALKLVLLIGGAAALFALGQYYLGYDPIRGSSLFRPQFGHSAVTGFFSHHLSFAGQSLIFVIMTAAWILDKQTGKAIRWLIPVLVVMGLALVLSFARSAWLGVLAGLLVLLVQQPSRQRRWGISAGLMAGVLLLPVSPVREHLLRVFELQQHATRLNLWSSSWAGIKANPLLGFGPGNFESLLAEFKVPGHYDTLAHSHNDWLMHGVNAGLPGMLAAVALIIVVCILMWGASRLDSPFQWIFKGVLAVQVGISVAGFFQVFQTDDEVEMLLYFVLGIGLALTRQLASDQKGSQSSH